MYMYNKLLVYDFSISGIAWNSIVFTQEAREGECNHENHSYIKIKILKC
jgi:hypothetical protein